MVLTRKLKTIARLPPRDICVVAEAAVALVVARALIVAFPFSSYARLLREPRVETPVSPGVVRRVGWAVRCAARNAPFDAKCLAQAMAARAMLSRRRHVSVLHLGVKHGETGLEAHAWLTAGAMIVVGAGLQGFAEVARFGGANARILPGQAGEGCRIV